MKELGMVLTPQDELRKLINEHPDVKIVVCADADLCNCNGDYRSYYAPEVYFSYGEILNCEQNINDEKIYNDRDEFREDVEEWFSYEHEEITDEKEFDEAVDEIVAEYEPYWENVIFIWART